MHASEVNKLRRNARKRGIWAPQGRKFCIHTSQWGDLGTVGGVGGWFQKKSACFSPEKNSCSIVLWDFDELMLISVYKSVHRSRKTLRPSGLSADFKDHDRLQFPRKMIIFNRETCALTKTSQEKRRGFQAEITIREYQHGYRSLRKIIHQYISSALSLVSSGWL